MSLFRLKLPGGAAAIDVPLATLSGPQMPLVPAALIYRDLLGCSSLHRGPDTNQSAEDKAMMKALSNAIRPPKWMRFGHWKANLSYPMGTLVREHHVLSLSQALRALSRYDYVSTAANCKVRPSSPGVLCPYKANSGTFKLSTSNCAIKAQAMDMSIHAVALGTSLATQLPLLIGPTTACPANHVVADGRILARAASSEAAPLPDRLEQPERQPFKAHVLDALDFSLPQELPNVWRPASKILDVGAGQGEIASYLTAKHGVQIKAYDVSAPKDNKWGMGGNKWKNFRGFPVEVFNGRTLPLEADRSHDVVMFNSVLHHAAGNAKSLIREAARIARRAIVLIEDVDVTSELNPLRYFVSARNVYHDRAGIFRQHQTWISMLENETGFVVTGSRSVHPYNVTNVTEYFQLHHIYGDKHILDLSGPTFMRLYVAQRCVRRHRIGERA